MYVSSQIFAVYIEKSVAIENYQVSVFQMAEEEVISGHVSDSDEENTLYKPPPEKSLDEIVNLDQEDESLRKYKETLLGASSSIGSAVVIGW